MPNEKSPNSDMQGLELAQNLRSANQLYLTALSLMLVGSIILVPRIGIGFNIWVNELVFFLMPVTLLARRKRWRWRDAYALRPAPAKAIVAAALAGLGLWIFNATLVTDIESILVRYVGPNMIPEDIVSGLSPMQLAAFIFGLVALAPFCEEVFFRGMMQKAYSRCGEKQAFIITSVLFGLYHALNGVSNVIPATVIGFALGYSALKTGSIWPGIALHTANNLLAGLATLAGTGRISGPYVLSALNRWIAIAVLRWGSS